MQLTPIYKFKKRELTDSPPDITANNSNWDVLETNLKNHGDSIAAQGKQIDGLNEKSFKFKGALSTFNKADKDGYYYVNSGDNTFPYPYGILYLMSDPNGEKIATYETTGNDKSTHKNRYTIGSGWTGWENKIGTLCDDRGYVTSKSLPTGIDLDSINKNGIYAYNDYENYINRPPISFGNVVGTMFVNCAFGCTSQIIISSHANTIMLYRNELKDGIWQPWKQIATTDKIDTLSNRFSDYNMIPTFSGGKGGQEGGEIHLAKPDTDTDLKDVVIVDVLKNNLRFYCTTDSGERIANLDFKKLTNNSQIATTDKVNISCIPKTGITITAQNSFQINNIIHYTIGLKKTDDSMFMKNVAYTILTVPNGNAYSTSLYGVAINQDANAWSVGLTGLFDTGTRSFIVTPYENCHDMIVSGMVVLV